MYYKLYLNTMHRLLVLILIFSVLASKSQSIASLPETLKLSKTSYMLILQSKPGTLLKTSDHFPFTSIKIISHTHNGDMEFIQAQVPELMNYYLNIQINGVYSTIIHLLPTEPKSNAKEAWSYSGTILDSEIIFNRIQTDALYSE